MRRSKRGPEATPRNTPHPGTPRPNTPHHDEPHHDEPGHSAPRSATPHQATSPPDEDQPHAPDHPRTPDHPATEHPTAAPPATEHPLAEHPATARRAAEHPTAEHPSTPTAPAAPTGAGTAAPPRTRTWLRATASAASLALAAYLVAAVVPAVAGVGWDAITDRLTDVGPLPLLGLTALWLAGLWAYTHVLTGSLPGLSHTRAFSLNAAGSAVSNLLPFGGAAGVAVTVVMASSWGFTARAITTSTIVTGLWNTLFRVALPLLALAVQGAAVLGHGVLAATLTTAAALAVAVVLVLRLRRLAGLLRGRARRFLVRLHRETARVVRAGWLGMTLGMTAYLALQALLLWCCLDLTGTGLSIPALVAAFAVSRLLTLAVITPGGFGVSENGTIALLVALGTPAAPAVAGVLLFAFFTYVLEIPLGGVLWLSWWVRRARSA
ncbi:lysylphosphatidylglycerol synthase transmembrane domain-containing protein [Saccharothrix australiensis]|uniref:lysylphosphatidylglycerol synthase transmembrane domain-containing protein n=1 Tax=Saccharothrix australiensis TaxID=2072 RepID=UPI001B875AFF|nr:YbhN family protein [Saccharothrix australiensis]